MYSIYNNNNEKEKKTCNIIILIRYKYFKFNIDNTLIIVPSKEKGGGRKSR